jgi:hypothetical protein
MAHLADKQFMAFLGLLAPGDVEEDAEHDPSDDAFVVALAAGGDPPHQIAVQDAEVHLVGTDDPAGGREGGPDAVAVSRVDARG